MTGRLLLVVHVSGARCQLHCIWRRITAWFGRLSKVHRFDWGCGAPVAVFRRHLQIFLLT